MPWLQETEVALANRCSSWIERHAHTSASIVIKIQKSGFWAEVAIWGYFNVHFYTVTILAITKAPPWKHYKQLLQKKTMILTSILSYEILDIKQCISFIIVNNISQWPFVFILYINLQVVLILEQKQKLYLYGRAI